MKKVFSTLEGNVIVSKVRKYKISGQIVCPPKKSYKSITLFFSGIIIAFLLTDLEALGQPSHHDDLLNFLIFSLSFGGYLTNFSYYVILIVLLPFVAIPELKKKLGPKPFSVYVFAAGISFWGAVDGLYIMLFV